MLNNLVIDKLKEVMKLQDIIKTDELYYKSRLEKTYNVGEISLSIVFLRDIHEGHLSLKDVDDKQSKFVNEIKNIYMKV